MKANNQDYTADDFLEGRKIPDFNPVSQVHKRISWFKEQKRRSIDGHWISGKWMPGILYFYVNFCLIDVEKDGGGKKMGFPWLRDIEWDKAYYKAEAMGFSGFHDDEHYSCNRLLLEELTDEELIDKYCTEKKTGKRKEKIYNNLFNSENKRKEYITAR